MTTQPGTTDFGASPGPFHPSVGRSWVMRVLGGAGLVLGLLFGSSAAAAQGFGVYEQSACTMARAGTAVAHPCADGSALYFNPAAVGLLPWGGPNAADSGGAWTASAGLTVIGVSGSFRDDFSRQVTALDTDPIPVPHLFVTRRAADPGSGSLADRIGAGIGVFVPYGLTSRWPRGFDGAFEGYDNRLESIYIQPTVSVALTPRIAIGGGPILALSTVELAQLLDLSQQSLPIQSDQAPDTFGELGVPFHTAFADSRLESDRAAGAGFHLGIRADVGAGWHVGARYMSSVGLEYTGLAEFEPVPTGLVLPIELPLEGFSLPPGTPVDLLLSGLFGDSGPLTTQAVRTELTMPAQWVAGVAWARGPLLLLADVQWTRWSAFDRVLLRFEQLPDQLREQGFRDTGALRFGAEYADVGGWALRAGALVNEAAAPDETVTPLLPEAERNHWTLGAGRSFGERVTVDVAWQYLDQSDRRGRTRDILPDGPPDRRGNHGIYEFEGHLFGVTLRLHF